MVQQVLTVLPRGSGGLCGVFSPDHHMNFWEALRHVVRDRGLILFFLVLGALAFLFREIPALVWLIIGLIGSPAIATRGQRRDKD